MDHCVKTCCETHEERQRAVLHHLLNGICVSQPDVPSCKFLGHRHALAMRLLYEICTLLLSACKHKQLTQDVFRLCFMSLDLKTGRSDCEHNLFCMAQQHLTRWAPLYNCGAATVDTISRIGSFGSGSLLELATLHRIHLVVTAPDKDRLCNVLVHHLVFWECQTTSAMLCICLALLPCCPHRKSVRCARDHSIWMCGAILVLTGHCILHIDSQSIDSNSLEPMCPQ